MLDILFFLFTGNVQSPGQNPYQRKQKMKVEQKFIKIKSQMKQKLKAHWEIPSTASE